MEPTPTIDPAMRAELLARLGLPPTATAGHIEAAYRASYAVLDRMPASEADYVAGQKAELDALRSLLIDTAPAAAAATTAAIASDAPVAEAGSVATKSNSKKWLAVGAAALVLLVGGGFAYKALNSSSVPGITGKPTNTTQPAANQLDQKKVAALMQNITANPKDFKSYMALADMYFQTGDYKNTAVFTSKALEIKPTDVTALVADGAANFNAGSTAIAIKDWKTAIKLDPKNVEAHYDLGFAYLSGSKPNLAAVQTEWETVVRLAPNSDIAKNVKTHLSSLKSTSKTSGQ